MEIPKPKDERHQYKYTPLPKERAIRVLCIDSKPEEEIRCSFEILDLDTQPTYDCLSYTWGYPQYQELWAPADKKVITGEAIKLIECEGKGFLVAENLYEGLKQLCKKKWKSSESNEQGYSGENCIWIDAVCINQKDDVEKSSQIKMMRDIYKGAESVVVWLGPDSDDPEAADLASAMKVLERLASVPSEKWNSDLPDDLYDRMIYEILGIEQTRYDEWFAFAGFILRSWFSRIWVVQERWAAKKMIVFCGDLIIDWKVLSDGIMTLKATDMDRRLTAKVEECVNFIPTDPATRFVTNRIRNQFIFTDIDRSQPLKLEKLLAYSRYFNTTVADDRVFAVLGMWVPSNKFTGKDPSELLPWAKAKASGPQEIYTKASFVAIQEMGDLNLLSLVEDASSRKLPNLPSWVPDYTVSPVMEPLNGIPRANEGNGPWNASRGLSWEEPKEENGILLVHGVKLDTVAESAANLSEIVDERKFCTLLALLQTTLSSYPAHASMEQFWRALIKDNYQGKPAADDARRAFPMLITNYVWELHIALTDSQDNASNPEAEPTWREDNQKEFKKFESIMSETKDLVSMLSTQEDSSLIPTWETIQGVIALGDSFPEDLEAKLQRILANFRLAYIGRRLIRTSDNYLGIAPQSVKNDDEIWLLAGAFVPMILRREENSERRRLVGEAYINGYMNGETVDVTKMTTLEII